MSDDLKGQNASGLYNPGFPGLAPERDGKVNMDSDDISNDARQTLGDFLKDLTSDNKRPVPTAGSTPLPADVHINSEGADGTFQGDLNNLDNADRGATRFSNTKRGSVGKGERSPLSTYRDDLEAGGDRLSPEEIADVETIAPHPREPGVEIPRDTGTDLQEKISDVLRYNRFNPDPDSSSFIENGEFSKGLWSKQSTLGKYDPPEGVGVTVNDLKKTARAMLLEASGEFGIDPNSVEQLGPALAMIPSLTQMGVMKVDTHDLRAISNQTVTGDRTDMTGPDVPYLTQDDVSGGLLDLDSTLYPQKSYGVLNSPDNPFGAPGGIGGTNVGMITVAATAYGALMLVSTILDLIMATDLNPNGRGLERNEFSQTGSPFEMVMGSSRAGTGWSFQALKHHLNLADIDYPFDRCLNHGVSMFYGIYHPPDKIFHKGMIKDFIKGLGKVSVYPGYYAVMHRMIIQDISSFIVEVTDFFKGKSAMELAIAMASGAFSSILEGFFNTKAWLFMRRMAELGNASIVGALGSLSFQHHHVDSKPYGALTRHQKSRVHNKDLLWPDSPRDYPRYPKNTLAWAHRTMPSRYLTPFRFIVAESQFGVSNKTRALLKERSTDDVVGGGAPYADSADDAELGSSSTRWDPETQSAAGHGRLSKEYVKFIEQNLEAEYCPFYFHDLRTNEIIAFHAFIESISDGFSVDYNKVGGYGRQDDVHVYSKTSRAISLTFTLAATSEEDHEVMYYNINKLVSMCYPQYSAGRVVTVGKEDLQQHFTVPFSQIQTASPMIRLRLGDLFKSNYSRFGLGRLFGMGLSNDQFKVGDAGALAEAADAQAALDKYNKSSAEAHDLTNAYEQTLIGDPFGNFTEGMVFDLKYGAKFYLRKNTDSGAPGPWASSQCYVAGGSPDNIPATCWEIEHIVHPTPPGTEEVETISSYYDLQYVYDIGEGNITFNDLSEMLDPGDPINAMSYSAGENTVASGATLQEVDAEGGVLWDVHMSSIVPTSARAGYFILKPTIEYSSDSVDWLMAQFLPLNVTDYTDIRIKAYASELEYLPVGKMMEIWQVKLDELYNGTTPPSQLGEAAASAMDEDKLLWNHAKSVKNFLDPVNNSVVRAFESSRGQGLAGVITQMDIDGSDSLWGDNPEKDLRAPMAVKITVGFSPIHDLPIGLDSDGMMTSAPYGVGSIVKDRFGHVYSDDNNSAGNEQLKGKKKEAPQSSHLIRSPMLKKGG